MKSERMFRCFVYGIFAGVGFYPAVFQCGMNYENAK